MATDAEGRVGQPQYLIAVLITFVCMIVGVTHVIRDRAAIDAVVVWLLLIAIFPWSGGFIKTFEILGVKGELREFRKKLDELSGATQDANQMSAVAAEGGFRPDSCRKSEGVFS